MKPFINTVNREKGGTASFISMFLVISTQIKIVRSSYKHIMSGGKIKPQHVVIFEVNVFSQALTFQRNFGPLLFTSSCFSSLSLCTALLSSHQSISLGEDLTFFFPWLHVLALWMHTILTRSIIRSLLFLVPVLLCKAWNFIFYMVNDFVFSTHIGHFL